MPVEQPKRYFIPAKLEELRLAESVGKSVLSADERITIVDKYYWGDKVVLTAEGIVVEQKISPRLSFLKRLFYKGPETRDISLETDESLQSIIESETICQSQTDYLQRRLGEIATNHCAGGTVT